MYAADDNEGSAPPSWVVALRSKPRLLIASAAAALFLVGAFVVPTGRDAARAGAVAEPEPTLPEAVATAPAAAERVTEAEPMALPAVGPADFAVSVEAVSASSRVPKPEAVRGVYLNVWAAASAKKLAKLIDMADRTEVNAFVIDVKDATGYLSYGSTIPLAGRIGADRERRIADVRGMLERLKEHGIYPIARIVVFRDPVLAAARPDWAVRTRDGAIWEDRYGDVWVDAFNRSVWDYNIAVAEEAVRLGFAEVQWDYVRFPDTPSRMMTEVVFPAQEGRTKRAAIREFLQYSRERLAELEVPVTADVFGLTTSVAGDMGIGQDWPLMVDATDVLLPMVYPSHYVRGSYGIAFPNGSPYETVKTAREHGIRRSADVADAAAIRPWLQDFTLGEPKYGPEYVRAQIEATYDAGLSEWLLWNASSNYQEAALATARGRVPRFEIPHFMPEPAAEPLAEELLGEALRDTALLRLPW